MILFPPLLSNSQIVWHGAMTAVWTHQEPEPTVQSGQYGKACRVRGVAPPTTALHKEKFLRCLRHRRKNLTKKSTLPEIRLRKMCGKSNMSSCCSKIFWSLQKVRAAGLQRGVKKEQLKLWRGSSGHTSDPFWGGHPPGISCGSGGAP